MPDVQYPYAYDENDRLVSIRDVRKDNRATEYHCPCCHELMHPRLGDIRAHCFAHASGKKCSEESYLHKVAKEIFIRRLKEGNLILRVQGVASCSNDCKYKQCESSVLLDHNISEIYDLEPEVEKSIKIKMERFVPDIVLYSSQDIYPPINVEIFVTHSCSQRIVDLCRNILEIPVKEFKDLESLEKEFLVESSIRTSNEGYPATLSKLDHIFRFAECTPEQFKTLGLDPMCMWSEARYTEFLRVLEIRENEGKLYAKSERQEELYIWKLCRNCFGFSNVKQIAESEVNLHEDTSEYEIVIWLKSDISRSSATEILSSYERWLYNSEYTCYDCKCVYRSDVNSICLIGSNGTKESGWSFDKYKARKCEYFQPRHKSSQTNLDKAGIWRPNEGWSDISM